MTVLRLSYVQRFKDRHGRVRHYYRRAGFPRVALPGKPGSQPFREAYEAALANTERKPIGQERSKPGSISALIAAYYGSTDWTSRSEITRRNDRYIIERFRSEYGAATVRDLTTDHLSKIIASRKPGAGLNLRRCLTRIMAHAVQQGWRADNPVLKTARPKLRAGGFRAWSDDDIAAFEARHLSGSMARLAFALLLYTGQRRSDVAGMGRQHVRGGRIEVTQWKGRERAGGPTKVSIPIHQALAREIAQVPADRMTFVIGAWGGAFNHVTFSHWFVDRAKEAGLTGLSPHGLRKAAARHLAEAGCTPHEIAAVTGHKTLKEIERYTESANQRLLADAAMARIGVEAER